jgi:hypothetical protein
MQVKVAPIIKQHPADDTFSEGVAERFLAADRSAAAYGSSVTPRF